ncbi:hypothetical protein AAFF_G00427890 [Aldrovandia affinis]|uniref:DUF5641 domain-containing protein n=1 Tax=Aldrovandia affinis TaxID=143900 RepID=A0AAD7R369_9TELE|nr:hypothetical protein AAFF_G00427890 [Aldrovandia affinis]
MRKRLLRQKIQGGGTQHPKVRQRDSFPEEVRCLAAGKPVPSSSCLITLAPEYDVSLQLIRGGLRRCQELEPDVIHPVVLDPRHVVTKLLIRQVDSDLNTQVKVSRRSEKRWGLLFKCLTTRAVHIESYLVAATGGPVKYCPTAFWAQFLHHYLPTLQTRSKWAGEHSPSSAGDCGDDPRSSTTQSIVACGKISKVFPGADGLIQTGRRLRSGIAYARPVSRLIRLLLFREDDAQ